MCIRERSGAVAGALFEAGARAGGLGDAIFWVEDDGVGLAPSLSARAFSPYEMGGAAAPDPSRMGLGLARVALTAAALGGSATVSSTRGGGARFELRVPARARLARANSAGG